jgi:hypothetical protein
MALSKMDGFLLREHMQRSARCYEEGGERGGKEMKMESRAQRAEIREKRASNTEHRKSKIEHRAERKTHLKALVDPLAGSGGIDCTGGESCLLLVVITIQSYNCGK